MSHAIVRWAPQLIRALRPQPPVRATALRGLMQNTCEIAPVVQVCHTPQALVRALQLVRVEPSTPVVTAKFRV